MLSFIHFTKVRNNLTKILCHCGIIILNRHFHLTVPFKIHILINFFFRIEPDCHHPKREVREKFFLIKARLFLAKFLEIFLVKAGFYQSYRKRKMLFQLI